MVDVTIDRAWLVSALGGASERLRRVVDRAFEATDVSAADVFSLADWIEELSAGDADGLGLLAVALFASVNEGSLAVEATEIGLRRRLGSLLDGEDTEPWLAHAVTTLRAGRFAGIIGTAAEIDAERHPILLWNNGRSDFLYFQKHLRAERDLHGRLRQRAARENRDWPAGTIERALREVLEIAPLRSGRGVIRLDADQLTALVLSLIRDLVIVSGGPGTGKTSVVVTVLRCLARLGIATDRIALAAPTGRAAQRLGDSIRFGIASLGPDAEAIDQSLANLSAVTLHSLLQFNPTRNVFRRHEENVVLADVVLVDEVSMISVDHFASLLRALHPDAKLILLGDKDQLPSVDAGAALGQLAPSDRFESGSARGSIGFRSATAKAIEQCVPAVGSLPVVGDHWLVDTVVVLRTNHRSERGIQVAAEKINAMDASIVSSLPRFDGSWVAAELAGGCAWWEQTQGSVGELQEQLHAWASHVYDEPIAGGASFRELTNEAAPSDDFDDAASRQWLTTLFAGLERTRLLTLVREGAWGCGPINDALAFWLRRRSECDRMWMPGTPILITRNDPTTGLFNGDVGLVVKDRSGRSRIAFARRGGFVGLPPESLPAHELGFALTVHKSQGSEFSHTLVILPPKGGRRLMTKELLYTAVTRAKRLAIISATADAFRVAVENRIIRESGMF